MNRVLVTGAETPTGREIVRQLSQAGYQVRALIPLGTDCECWRGHELDVVAGELTDAKLVGKILRDIEGLIHLYVRPAPPEGVSESENFRHNLSGTFNLVRLAAESAGRLERFVCGSSSSVYPNDSHVLRPAYHPVDEQHPLRPLDAYALARLGGERIAWAYAQSTGLPVTVIRESGVATEVDLLGRWTVDFVHTILEIGQQSPQSELYTPAAAEALAELERLATSPDQPCAVTGPEGRPWLYQLIDYRDLAQGVIYALTHPQAVGRTYNLAGPYPISFVQAAHLLGEALNQPVLEWQAPVRWVFDLDTTRARCEIGYRPKWTIERMINAALS